METSTAPDLLATFLPAVAVVFLIAVGVVLLYQQFQKSLYKQQLEKEALKNAHQHELLVSSIAVQETERKRIASDLHDQLGAALSMSRMQLVLLENEGSTNTHKLTDIRNMVETALADTRRISHELMPVQLLNAGLLHALKDLAHRASESSNTVVTTEIATETETLPWAAKLGLYRIFCELLNNTLKHGAATTAVLQLAINGSSIVASYRDNGVGLSTNKPPAGLGLSSIEARAKALNGNFEFGNRETGGFYATITLPIDDTIASHS